MVGIGASAGGLDAFRQLLERLPSDSGMAFVLIQHLDPRYKSVLATALGRATRMPVVQVEHGQRAQPNHVYVTPPNADVSIDDDILNLSARKEASSKPHLQIDDFFTSLAAARRGRAIGVVLSGTASDGTDGLRAIKAECGITLAQDPRSAKFAAMPQNAIDAGVVDFSFSIAALAKELARLSRHPYFAVPEVRIEEPDSVGEVEPSRALVTPLSRILSLIKASVGVDFNQYKCPTIERRLARRMALGKVETREGYLSLLRRDSGEIRALSEDLLIHVSSFFRDPRVFETLKATVLPEILRHKSAGEAIRVWVAGCSTGEEAYSIAISLLESFGDAAQTYPLQVFGSDISEGAIRTARAGSYSEGSLRGVSSDRRRRFFTKTETGFRVNKSVRDMCIFVHHDLACDPPFSKIDLLSCRNVLIYFDQGLQKRILPAFHYSLNLPGFLVLGGMEQISGFSQLFSPYPPGNASKIFVRSALHSRLLPLVQRAGVGGRRQMTVGVDPPDASRRMDDISKHLDKLMLARYAPAGVLINEKMEVLQFRGHLGLFLQPAPGEPQIGLFKMAHGSLLLNIRATLARARRERAPARTEGVEIDGRGPIKVCDIVVLPFAGIPHVKERLFVVLFEIRAPVTERAARSPKALTAEGVKTKASRRIAMLDHELMATTEYLRSVIEDKSQTNDELGAANEELVSGNEELQSLNEELETAKEELQSTNEELTTVNDELHARILEVAQANNDLVNLFDTVDIPIVIVDRQRRIRRFTPQARSILNVVASDVGRSLGDIRLNIDAPDLDQRIAEVIETLVPKEWETRDGSGRWYRVLIRPYRAEGAVDGAIVSLLDIETFKQHLREVQLAKEKAELADRAKDQFLAVLSHELRTPLTSLLMQTQLLRDAGSDVMRRDRACGAIERSTKMQMKLIDDLLDVSRIVTGKLRVDLQPVSLVAAVEAALASIAGLAAGRSIELKVSLDQSLALVAGDRTRLEQIVLNLLGNALKFTPKGGRIDLSLEAVAGLAHLKIADNGIGIDPSFLPRIFERLTQTDASSTREHAGLGLGLAIVRHLVDAHGGTVRAESAGLGKGATLSVTLPLISSTPTASSLQPPASREVQRVDNVVTSEIAGRRILVVEDDTAVREAIAETMARGGAIVKTAESATTGMLVFRRFRPEALVCDIAMPGEDGYVFIRKIRALGAERGGDVPALALTALAGEADRRRALGEGFQMYIAKPIEIAFLVQAMGQILRVGKAAPKARGRQRAQVKRDRPS